MVKERVVAMGRPDVGFQEEALTALLRCGAGYDDVAVPMSTVPFNRSRVALPTSVWESPMLVDLLGADDA
eukprot:6491429-Amphidinium_carterae.3